MKYCNHVRLGGRVLSKPFFAEGKKLISLETMRDSGVADTLKILWDDREDPQPGDKLALRGRIATVNLRDGGLLLFVRPQAIYEFAGDINEVALSGNICKNLGFRATPRGRGLCSFVVGQGGSYIPCVAWGEDARRVAARKTGGFASLTGRLQSRSYAKRGLDETRMLKTFEVSADSVDMESFLGLNDKGR